MAVDGPLNNRLRSGEHHYAGGRQGQWFVIGLTARQTGYSLYFWGFVGANPSSRPSATGSGKSKSARVV